jgi:spore coat protein CotF
LTKFQAIIKEKIVDGKRALSIFETSVIIKQIKMNQFKPPFAKTISPQDQTLSSDELLRSSCSR